VVRQLWQAVGRARIVHTGFGSWPIREGWLVVPIAKLQKRFVLTVVESSDWRASGAGVSWHRRLRSYLSEVLTQFCVRIADLRLFSSKAYLLEFLPAEAPRAFVNPPSWVEEEWILDDEAALTAWSAKEGPTRVLYAGRLIPVKGVSVLLAAIRAASSAGASGELTIIGSGDLREECEDLSRSLNGTLRVKVLDPLPYGEPFLTFLRGFDAVVVPSLSDELPRILYDSLSQAVPVIGSSTAANCEVVESGLTGRLVSPSDVGALAEALIWAGENRKDLRAMGLRGPIKMRSFTHRSMHRNRCEILHQALGGAQATKEVAGALPSRGA
jgi:glycosyltransferase involved in cell wall biosynthesis